MSAKIQVFSLLKTRLCYDYKGILSYKVNAAVVLKDHVQLFAEYYVKSISLFQKEALGIPSLPRGTKICIFIKKNDR